MIRHPPLVTASSGPVAPVAPVPAWLRAAAAAPQSLEDAAFAAAAAAEAAKRAGRMEDAAALRDALLLTRPGDNFGPAGRMLLI
ncbi:DUF1403 family protein [Mesorhizobium sp. AR10]|uniref:DUF1403 family protein n=1 Tax=Mesorhizobium sp. AR10 TaxID=2865839 RepID=UPI0021601587|nr:DUF1403 family protein [Mesorhizobium sp. AR10]